MWSGINRNRSTGLAFLLRWFQSHCDGDWEHDDGIMIETLDNPGWSIRIRIEGTELEGRVTPWVRLHDDSDEHVWLYWHSSGTEFRAACGPTDLPRALAAFQLFASAE